LFTKDIFTTKYFWLILADELYNQNILNINHWRVFTAPIARSVFFVRIVSYCVIYNEYMSKLIQFQACLRNYCIIWKDVPLIYELQKELESYFIDKPIFLIQSDIVHVLRTIAVSRHLRSSLRKGCLLAGNFFQKGDQFKRSKKIRVHPSGTSRSSAWARSLD